MKSLSVQIDSFTSQLDEINRQYHEHNKLEFIACESGKRLKVTCQTQANETVALTDWLDPQQAVEYLQKYKQKYCLDPNKLERFFSFSDAAKIISIHRLKPTRARKKGIRNAFKYMREAYHGLRSKRKPISVRPSGKYKNCYDILDGNSTWHVAKKIGMEVLPAQIVKG
ncbi:hypothetical protein NC796_13900 [Aliifodinibius sp. S!AR15-10]|uniref:hypothetical protein n=1 Tax=Aliifodinibius sp. S!AR15-10 TaxID=2950437 RepID=UPI002862DC56|nr:hypothetical protein [Aliifodinibius sp. S!AR15-10]MDR8392242.1 hypothetical protein [Aliifodinibius sp. S!AR15-10]